MQDLVVVTPGAQVRKAKSNFRVQHQGEVLMRLPTMKVGALVAGPGVEVGRSAIDFLHARQVPLLWVTENGVPIAWLASAGSRQAEAHLAQARTTLDPEIRRDYAEAFILAKLSAMRCAEPRLGPQRSLHGQPIDGLRGIEGASSRAYYQLYWNKWPDGWHMNRRSKRPPADPANALLSWGYTLLGAWMTRAVLIKGLNPGWGYVHTPHHGMPALVQDLIEPLRSQVVDPWALDIALSGDVIGVQDFETAGGRCYIRENSGLKSVTRSFLATLDKPLKSARIKRARTARSAMSHLVGELRAAINQQKVPEFGIFPLTNGDNGCAQ